MSWILIDVLNDSSALRRVHRGQGGVEGLVCHVHVRDPVVVIQGEVVVQDKVDKVASERNILGAFKDDQIVWRRWPEVNLEMV